jgi:hypothetical protein
MGNQSINCTCCKDKGPHNASDDYEIKKTDGPNSYPAVMNISKSSESIEKGYVYVPEEISSIDFIPYSEDLPVRDPRPVSGLQDRVLGNTISLGTIQEISNSEINDFHPSNFLDTQEMKINLSTSENLSKVLELKLSDSYGYGDSEFDRKLGKLQ